MLSYVDDDTSVGVVPVSTDMTHIGKNTDYGTYFNMVSNEYVSLPKPESEETVKTRINTLKALYSILSKPRNIILPLNENRQDHISKYIENHADLDDKDFQELVMMAGTPTYVDDEKHGEKKSLIDQLLFNKLTEFNYQFVPNEDSHGEQKYVNYKLDTEKYKIVKFSKDISNKFKYIEENFSELKELLKYDESTGFYCYEDIPILCSHLYMIYDGVPLQEMSAKCYKDGKCRYCGTSLMNYSDVIFDSIPIAVSALLLSYCHCFENRVNSDRLYYKLYGMFSTIIRDNKDKFGKDLTILAFCGLFILKCIRETQNTTKIVISYDQKLLSKLLDKIKETTTRLGWTPNQIDSTIKNNPMLSGLSNIVDIIANCRYADAIEEDIYSAAYLESILFDKMSSSDKAKITSLFGKTFNAGQAAIDEYNKKYYEFLLKIWAYRYLDALKQINDFEDNTEYVDIRGKIDETSKMFFQATAEYYCPANEETHSHEWDSNKCRLCGLEKSLKNVHEIYKKFFKTITEQNISSSVGEPVFKQKDSKVTDAATIVAEISKMSVQKIDLLDKILSDESMRNILTDFICSTLNIHISEVPSDNEFFGKALGYIIAKKLLAKNDIMDNLLFIYETSRKYTYS